MMLTLLPDSDFLGLEPKQGRRTFSEAEAEAFNKIGYGVFATPNKFNGRALISNLEEIRWCFFEIDTIDKEDQFHIIGTSPLKPSMLIESKNSYHCYFRVVDCDLENFDLIQRGLIKYFDSDIKIKNVNRLMRVPGFYHMKDPTDPFLIRKVFSNSIKYGFETLRKAFPYTPPPKKEFKIDVSLEHASTLVKFLSSYNCEKALQKLSGTPFVNYELYSFKKNSNGKKNIYVNGKSTSCFITEEGMIGASHGPTVWQWLRYFGHTDSEIGRIINEVFNV